MQIQAAFDNMNWTLLLPVDKSALHIAGDLAIDSKAFQPKPELHCTVVGFAQAKKIKAAIAQDGTLAERLAALAQRSKFDLKIGDGERRHIGKQKPGGWARSIVQMVTVDGVAEFVRALSDAIGEEIEVPPMHITTHTHLDAMGIGIPTAQALEECTLKILA